MRSDVIPSSAFLFADRRVTLLLGSNDRKANLVPEISEALYHTMMSAS